MAGVLWRAFVLLPAALLAIALLLVWLSGARSESDRLLDLHGAETTGVVTSREIYRGGERPRFRVPTVSRPEEETNYVGFRFTPRQGEAISSEKAVSDAYFSAVSVGDEIVVRYVLHAPDIHEIEPGLAQRDARLARIGAYAFFAAAALAAFWSWRRTVRHLTILRRGGGY